MLLTALDRIALATLLPVRGDFLSLSTAESLRKKIAFSDAEREGLSIRSLPDGNVTWNPAADVPSDREFSPVEVDFVKNLLVTTNDKRELLADQMGLYRLFVLTGEQNG